MGTQLKLLLVLKHDLLTVFWKKLEMFLPAIKVKEVMQEDFILSWPAKMLQNVSGEHKKYLKKIYLLDIIPIAIHGLTLIRH